MPGYDGTGPLGAGARTGRGLGRCGPPAGEDTAMEDPYNDYGIGGGYWPWGGGSRGGGRGPGGRGWGRGRRRGGAMGRAAAAAPAGAGPAPAEDDAFIRGRIQALKEEIEAWKRRLSGGSPSEGSDQE